MSRHSQRSPAYRTVKSAETWQTRSTTRRRSGGVILSLLGTGILACTAGAHGTLHVVLDEGERSYLTASLSHGVSPICIEVSAIRDRSVAEAILVGARRRSVRVVARSVSPELASLLSNKHVSVHISGRQHLTLTGTGRFGGSAVLEVEDGHYSLWRGPSVWTTGRYSRSTTVLQGSGFAFEPFTSALHAFDHDFAKSKSFSLARLYTLKHRIWPKRAVGQRQPQS